MSAAVGVGGAALTSILAHVPAETGLGRGPRNADVGRRSDPLCHAYFRRAFGLGRARQVCKVESRNGASAPDSAIANALGHNYDAPPLRGAKT
jgi:hypothetical protein